MKFDIRLAFKIVLLCLILNACEIQDNNQKKIETRQPPLTILCPTAIPKSTYMNVPSTETPEQSGQALQATPGLPVTTSSEEGSNVPNIQTREAMLGTVNLAPCVVDGSATVDTSPPPPDSATLSSTPEQSGQAVQSTPSLPVTVSSEDGSNVPNIQTREAMLETVNLAPSVTDGQAVVDTSPPPPESATFISATSVSNPVSPTPCP